MIIRKTVDILGILSAAYLCGSYISGIGDQYRSYALFTLGGTSVMAVLAEDPSKKKVLSAGQKRYKALTPTQKSAVDAALSGDFDTYSAKLAQLDSSAISEVSSVSALLAEE